MHELSELPAWERLLKRIVLKQLGEIKNKKILDFGSGQGVISNYYAKDNYVTAVEPNEEMLLNRWKDHKYRQIKGSTETLKEFDDDHFDVIICHNVLEYIDDKAEVLKELARVLNPDGFMSIVKHNRYGRVMQMAVLLDDIDKANDLLDGKDGISSKYGLIRYYEDSSICETVPELKIDRIMGIRTFFDLQQNQDKHADEDWQKKMAELEMQVAEIEELRNIAFFHHLIILKSNDSDSEECSV